MLPTIQNFELTMKIDGNDYVCDCLMKDKTAVYVKVEQSGEKKPIAYRFNLKKLCFEVNYDGVYFTDKWHEYVSADRISDVVYKVNDKIVKLRKRK